MNKYSNVKLFVLLLQNSILCLRIKIPCDTYKVFSTSMYTHQHHLEMLGVYKVDYRNRCFHRPVYKHMTTDRYIFFNKESHWSISDSKNLQGDSTTKPSCSANGYAYAPKSSQGKIPNLSGWNVHDLSSKHWLNDDSLTVSCVCSYIVISSNNPSLRFNAPFVLGRYHILPGFLCNNQVIYKHVKNDRYLYVDENNKWTISNSEELYGVGRLTACSRFGYVHNPSRPASENPSVKGWKFYISDEKKWVDDPQMKVVCEH